MSDRDIVLLLIEHLIAMIENLNRSNFNVIEIAEICEDAANRLLDLSEEIALAGVTREKSALL
jgi:hypothetical protein